MRGATAQVVPGRYRFTVADYHRMGETGILGEDARVELIEGEIIQMPPIGSHHAGSNKGLIALLVTRLGSRVVVSVQDPIALSDVSEPQPDLALLHPRDDFYASGHPTPDDVYLVIEVAESSRAFDLSVKARLYAQAGIPEYWVVDLVRRRIIVHRDPRHSVAAVSHTSRPRRRVKQLSRTSTATASFATILTFSPGDQLAPLAFPDCRLRVDEILR